MYDNVSRSGYYLFLIMIRIESITLIEINFFSKRRTSHFEMRIISKCCSIIL